MRRGIAFHPPLIAAFPVLSLYSANLALVPLTDLWRPLAIALACSAVLWLLASVFFKSSVRGAALASPVVAVVFLYGRVIDANADADKVLLANCAYVFGAAALVWLVARRWKRGDWQTPALNVLGTALVLSSIGSIAFGFAAERRHVGQIARNSDVAGTSKQANLPDVFYIILDGYGRQDQLQRIFGFDNSSFVKALEDRGFYVAKGAHSNYCQTELSLASSLNADYVQTLVPKAAPEDSDRSPLDTLVVDSGVAQTFKNHAYKTLAITSGFPAFNMEKADEWLHAPMQTTLFEASVLQMTPFVFAEARRAESMFVQRRGLLTGAFDNLASQAKPGAVPRFVFAHILMPHPPFVFKADGSPANYKVLFGYWDGSHYYEFGGTKADYSSGYTGQVSYLNQRILPIIDEIVRSAKTPPIILLQGDHGSKRELDQNSIDHTDIQECFSNLSAFYVPPTLRDKLYPSITPVNSFRLIFNSLFGESLPLLPDRSWYSAIGTPYKLIEVTDRLKWQITDR